RAADRHAARGRRAGRAGDGARGARRRARARRPPRARRPRRPPGGGMTTVDAVAAALRREILEGARPAGARLVEQELVARHGVARHTLRSALRALAAEGLVRIEPNRGARVARLSPDEVVWLNELRAAL